MDPADRKSRRAGPTLLAFACLGAILTATASSAGARAPAAEEYDLVVPRADGQVGAPTGSSTADVYAPAPSAAVSDPVGAVPATPVAATTDGAAGNDESVDPVGPRAAVKPVVIRPVGQIVPGAGGASGSWKMIALAAALLAIAGAGAWLRARQGPGASG